MPEFLPTSPESSALYNSKALAKALAYRMMTSSSAPYLSNEEIINSILSPRSEYTGSREPNRDLVGLYIYGDKSGFQPIKYTDPGIKGNYPAYIMHSNIPHGEPLHWSEIGNWLFGQDFNSPEELKAEIDKKMKNNKASFEVMGGDDITSPVNPQDDIAGHMFFVEKDPKTGNYMTTTRDVWDFDKGYSKRYNPKEAPYPVSLPKLQLWGARNIGNPFVLVQQNPIDFVTPKEQYESSAQIKNIIEKQSKKQAKLGGQAPTQIGGGQVFIPY